MPQCLYEDDKGRCVALAWVMDAEGDGVNRPFCRTHEVINRTTWIWCHHAGCYRWCIFQATNATGSHECSKHGGTDFMGGHHGAFVEPTKTEAVIDPYMAEVLAYCDKEALESLQTSPPDPAPARMCEARECKRQVTAEWARFCSTHFHPALAVTGRCCFRDCAAEPVGQFCKAHNRTVVVHYVVKLIRLKADLYQAITDGEALRAELAAAVHHSYVASGAADVDALRLNTTGPKTLTVPKDLPVGTVLTVAENVKIVGGPKCAIAGCGQVVLSNQFPGLRVAFRPYCPQHEQEFHLEWDFCHDGHCTQWASRNGPGITNACSKHGGTTYVSKTSPPAISRELAVPFTAFCPHCSEPVSVARLPMVLACACGQTHEASLKPVATITEKDGAKAQLSMLVWTNLASKHYLFMP